MVSRFLAFTQTMTLTSTLGYLTSCPPPMFKKRKNLPSSSCLGSPGVVTSKLLPNFPPSQGPLLHSFATSKQSVSFPRAHHIRSSFLGREKTFYLASREALKCQPSVGSTLTKKHVQLIPYIDNLNKWVSGWMCVCICVYMHIYIHICIYLKELDDCEFAFLP